jgi:hypothetical protein
LSELAAGGTVTLRPLLKRYPDARRAKVPLLDPILFPYLALMFGAPATAIVSLWNALALRRWGLALQSLLYGALGWLAFVLTLVAVAGTLDLTPVIALIVGRVVYFVFGGLLYLRHRSYARGHAYLAGTVVGIMPSYLAAYLLSTALAKYRLQILGVPF